MTTDPKVDPVVEPPKDESKTTAGQLRALIREEIASVADKIFPGGGAPKNNPPEGDNKSGGSIATQVADALAKLKQQEASVERDKKIDALIEKGTVEMPKESAPREVSRVHKFMKWGE